MAERMRVRRTNKKIRLYRHELKFYINYGEYIMLSKRLQLTLNADKNAVASNGVNEYFIRSLYFDDFFDSSLREKAIGVDNRDKYRLRAYRHNYDEVKLERKRKDSGYILKDSILLSRQECDNILDGDYGFLLYREEPFAREMYVNFLHKGLKPCVIVDYVREPYVFPYDDVRITFDKDIRTGFRSVDFCDSDIPTYPVIEDGLMVMEVKFNKVLPQYVRELIQTVGSRSAISKYCLCRKYE